MRFLFSHLGFVGASAVNIAMSLAFLLLFLATAYLIFFLLSPKAIPIKMATFTVLLSASYFLVAVNNVLLFFDDESPLIRSIPAPAQVAIAEVVFMLIAFTTATIAANILRKRPKK